MKIVRTTVNIPVYAHRPESPRHAEHRDWLEAARGGAEPLGLAAIAIEQGATWVSAARSFAGHPGLRWLRPLDHSSGVVTP